MPGQDQMNSFACGRFAWVKEHIDARSVPKPIAFGLQNFLHSGDICLADKQADITGVSHCRLVHRGHPGCHRTFSGNGIVNLRALEKRRNLEKSASNPFNSTLHSSQDFHPAKH